MLIQIQTSGNDVKSINVAHILMIEPAQRGGTIIYVAYMDSVYTPEDYFEVEKRVRTIFKEYYKI